MIERSEEFLESIEITDIVTDLNPNPNTEYSQEDMSMETPELASCNIPSQPYSPSINDENSLVCGTVFPDLVMPYEAGWHLYNMREEV